MRVSSIPALLSIALLGACGQAVAVESRQMASDGSESRSQGIAGGERADDADPDPNAPVTQAKRSEKAKAATSPRTGGGNRSTAPRWHSFLPGMFR